jgi:hypothetical protein
MAGVGFVDGVHSKAARLIGGLRQNLGVHRFPLIFTKTVLAA